MSAFAPVNLTDLAGVIHLHSQYSFDGRAKMAEIIAAANGCGCDFLMLTDHSTLQARQEGWEGWHNGTLLMVGEEIAPRFNHYLAFGLPEAIGAVDRSPQECIDRVREGGGIGFIAHPDHEGTALFHVKPYPWTAWSVAGYTGLGIWDFMTDWQKGLTGYLTAIASYVCPALFLRGPSAVTLARWDELTQKRPVVGIGELDNHDTPMPVAGLTFSVFSFARVLRLIRTHLLVDPLTGNAEKDKALLFDALKRGRAYVALDYFRSAKGFSVILTEGERSATMGDEFHLRREAMLQVVLPHRARIRVIRNGAFFRQGEGKTLSAAIDKPGVYRVEGACKVFGRYRPWIFSNPVYVVRD
ncbi:MAG: hypothetical protein M0009_04520 [Deltaproteobacteria bacterium]|nr:hypothetical protein [Deltaproteobacteria bacterium]